MLDSIRRNIRSLKSSTSGNATLLVALGMPVLMGSSGLAVDVAQWYMWQNELQFATDQAALAGAWASSSNTTKSTYRTRAQQEFEANLAATEGATSTPSVSLTNYFNGTNNAVRVTASVTKSLPFSTFITGRPTTVTASALATFTMTANYNACILSTNPTENRSVIFGNAITGGSDCGVGALSTGDQAIVETGDSEVALGDIISAGGIEDTFSNNGTLHENVTGLSDPLSEVTPPNPELADSPELAASYEYSCPADGGGSITWTADQTVHTVAEYRYKKGNVLSSAIDWTVTVGQPGYMAPSDGNPGVTTNVTYISAPTAGSTTAPTVKGPYEHVAGNGSNRIWRSAWTTVTTIIANVTGPITTGGSDGIARPKPGRYTNISIDCPTVFSSGIYFVSGTLDFGQNHFVTGSDVMFVMTGTSGSIRINSTSRVTISGITAQTLQDQYNVSEADAKKMHKLLFFDKENTSDFDVNGGATLDMDGVFYMPSREVKINGNMSTGTRCIMLVSDTFHITGSANLTNFCSPDGVDPLDLGERPASVRLVA